MEEPEPEPHAGWGGLAVVAVGVLVFVAWTLWVIDGPSILAANEGWDAFRAIAGVVWAGIVAFFILRRTGRL